MQKPLGKNDHGKTRHRLPRKEYGHYLRTLFLCDYLICIQERWEKGWSIKIVSATIDGDFKEH